MILKNQTRKNEKGRNQFLLLCFSSLLSDGLFIYFSFLFSIYWQIDEGRRKFTLPCWSLNKYPVKLQRTPVWAPTTYVHPPPWPSGRMEEARKVSTLIVNYVLFSFGWATFFLFEKRKRGEREREIWNLKLTSVPHLNTTGGCGSMLVPINSARPLLHPRNSNFPPFFFIPSQPRKEKKNKHKNKHQRKRVVGCAF